MATHPEAVYASDLADELLNSLRAKLTADGYVRDLQLMDSIALSAVSGALARLLGAHVAVNGATPEAVQEALAEVYKHVWIEARYWRQANGG